jgi:hypothetical protein
MVAVDVFRDADPVGSGGYAGVTGDVDAVADCPRPSTADAVMTSACPMSSSVTV